MQTIALKFKCLPPNKGKLEKIERMVQIYQEACSWFYQQAEALDTTNRNRMFRETYRKASSLFDLNRATLQCAMLKALSARRFSLSQPPKKSKRRKTPKFKRTPVRVRRDCYSIFQLRSGRWAIKFPVSSGKSQIVVPVVTSEYHARRLRDLTGGSCRQGPLEIWNGKDGAWYVSVFLIYEVKLNELNGVIGVDLGLVNLAVLSNNEFFNGRHLRWRKKRWAERRKGLHRAGRFSRIRKEADRKRKWMRYVNHCISKRIVELAKAEHKAIALESLPCTHKGAKGSREFNRVMSSWNFRELASFIAYKASLAGVLVIYIDPKNTSKTCPRCGNISYYNRSNQRWFKCSQCGYQSDADRVAALNIATRAHNALGACPLGKGECGTPKGQGDPVIPGERWLTCGESRHLMLGCPQSRGEDATSLSKTQLGRSQWCRGCTLGAMSLSSYPFGVKRPTTWWSQPKWRLPDVVFKMPPSCRIIFAMFLTCSDRDRAFRASIRDIAKMTGFSVSTVAHALKRLEAANVIRRLQTGTRSQTSKWNSPWARF